MRSLRHRASILVIIGVLVIATSAWADTLLWSGNGFDWFWPNDIGQPFGCYAAVGEVTTFNPGYVNYDFVANEYTFVFAEEYACFRDSLPLGGGYTLYFYDATLTDCTLRLYCDSRTTGTAYDYGFNPPDDLPIATFKDGDCILEGDILGDIFITYNQANKNGAIQAEIEWVGGSQIGNIPPAQRTMSVAYSGLAFHPPGSPPDYFWAIDPDVFIQDPVPVEPTSWGGMKQRLGGGN